MARYKKTYGANIRHCEISTTFHIDDQNPTKPIQQIDTTILGDKKLYNSTTVHWKCMDEDARIPSFYTFKATEVTTEYSNGTPSTTVPLESCVPNLMEPQLSFLQKVGISTFLDQIQEACGSFAPLRNAYFYRDLSDFPINIFEQCSGCIMELVFLEKADPTHVLNTEALLGEGWESNYVDELLPFHDLHIYS